MKLTPPAKATWVIALIIGTLGILSHERILHIPVGIDSFWLVTIGFVLLLIAPLMRGL